MNVCLVGWMDVCTYVQMCLCVCFYLCMHVYIFIYVCVCMYDCTFSMLHCTVILHCFKS